MSRPIQNTVPTEAWKHLRRYAKRAFWKRCRRKFKNTAWRAT